MSFVDILVLAGFIFSARATDEKEARAMAWICMFLAGSIVLYKALV